MHAVVYKIALLFYISGRALIFLAVSLDGSGATALIVVVGMPDVMSYCSESYAISLGWCWYKELPVVTLSSHRPWEEKVVCSAWGWLTYTRLESAQASKAASYKRTNFKEDTPKA